MENTSITRKIEVIQRENLEYIIYIQVPNFQNYEKNVSLNCSLDHCAGLETQPLMELLEQRSINLSTLYNYCLCWSIQFYLWLSAAFINPYIM